MLKSISPNMATVDDKLLAEKLNYYCSCNLPVASVCGPSINTGPKGVIKDLQLYKQIESEENEDQAAEKLGISRCLAFTCQTDKEDQETKEREENMNAEFVVNCLNLIKMILQNFW